MPSSWTRTRRASANAVSASACRPAPVQRQHQLPAEPLPERVRPDQPGQLAGRLGRPAELEQELDVLLGRGQPLLAEPGPDDLRPRAGNAVERVALPQPKRRLKRRRRRGQVAGPAGLARARQPPREQLRVELPRRQPQQVAAAAGQQQPGRTTGAPAPARAPPAAGRRARAARSPTGRAARHPRSRRSAHRATPTGSPAPPAARGPPAAAARRARVRFRRARPAPARARPPAPAARRQPARRQPGRLDPGRHRRARRRKSRSPPSGREHRHMTPDRIAASRDRPLNWHFQSTLREQQEAAGDS